MNNFHIYDQIGRGKHSVVYKGRKKRSLEYVAIKSTDKGQKGRVLQEVKVMHAAKHPNILHFHAWYETTNHLWLVLEYCVGGDLHALLRSDRALPEATVLRFARDVAAALQYLHSLGTLHCDLNPANLLLDENGRVKLGGFALSRRAGEPALPAAAAAAQAAQSLPFYTAPEVLTGTGQPSAASDLWSLGCVLYECAAGRPPFVASSRASLASLVASADPAPLIGTSPEFQDLVSRLLDRAPTTRLSWPELCTHPFWGASPLDPLEVPAELLAAAAVPRGPSQVRRSLAQQLGAQLARETEVAESDVSPPRLTVRHMSSDDVAAGLDPELEAGPEAGPTPLHPSSRQRTGAEQSGDDAAAQPAAEPPDALAALAWHPTDTAMKPIVGNRRIERPMEAAFAPSLLPFKPLSAQELLATPPPGRLAFLQTLQRVLSGSAHQHTKLAMLCYLETLALDTLAAHELINSELCVFMVRMLQHSSSAVLRARLANVIGLLVRHTSVIDDSLAQAGLVEVLAGGLHDADLDVQRRCTAALGELLFYIAAQQRGPAGAAGGAWAVPSEVVEGLAAALGEPGRDEVVQHYVVKTIENIAGQGGGWAQKFATPDVTGRLVEVVGASAHGADSFRGTAASALCRLLRCKPALLPTFLDQAGMGFLSKGMCDPSPRVQQAATTILCLLCSNRGTAQRTLAGIEAKPTLLRFLGSMLEHPVDVLKGKGVVAAALLCRGGPAMLGLLCSSGVLQRVEKVGREQSPYISGAMAALRGEVAALLPALLAQMEGSLRTLQQHGGSAGAAPSGGASGGSGAGSPALPQMPTLLYLLGSPTFRDVVVSDALVGALADILTRAVSSSVAWAGHQDVKGEVLQAIDGVCCHPELLLRHHQPVLSQLLPALSAAVASSKESSDTRFICLKLLCDIILQCVTEPSLYYPLEAAASGGGAGGGTEAAQDGGAAGALINSAVIQYVLPLSPALFADEDPMPLYALKMLGILLDVNPAWVAPLAKLGMAHRFFEWLSIDHPHNNVHLLRLCRLMAQSGALPQTQLLEFRVVDRVLGVLSYAREHDVEPFLEPSLELAMVLLEAHSAAAAGAEETGKLLPALPLLLDLCLHPEPGVAAAAAACAAGVTQLHTEDAAAILAADGCVSLPALLAAVLQPEDGGPVNEAAAYHLLHAAALAAQQPPFLRRREALEELALAARRALHSGNGSLKQKGAEVLTVLGGAVGGRGGGYA